MPIEHKKPLRVGETQIDRVTGYIYKDINDIITSVNSASESSDRSAGGIGDIRVNTKGLEYHNGSYWVDINIDWIKHQLRARLTIVDVPTTATSSGISGEVAYSDSHFYICVAKNTWKRVAIAAW